MTKTRLIGKTALWEGWFLHLTQYPSGNNKFVLLPGMKFEEIRDAIEISVDIPRSRVDEVAIKNDDHFFRCFSSACGGWFGRRGA